MNETNKAEDSCPSFIRFCAVLEACKCIDCQPISWIRIFVARSACWFKVKLYICCFNRYRPWAVRTDVNRVQRCLAKGMPFKVLHTGGTSGSRKRKMAVEERLKKLKLQKGMNGRVDVCIYKVSDDAGNCWRRFEGQSAALWQVQFEYTGEQKLFFGFTKSFVRFAEETNLFASSGNNVLTLLDAQFGVRLLETNEDDQDGAGFVTSPGSVFYVLFNLC